MNITIIAVGKLKERFWKEACSEYLKRLGGYTGVAIKEVPDEDPAKCGGINGAKEKEGKAILLSIPDRSHVILLSIEGRQRSSVDMAEHIKNLTNHGQSSLTYIIGGSDGVSEAVYERADEQQSFGPVTLPHNLARIILLEQIYRSFKIIRGEPYHK